MSISAVSRGIPIAAILAAICAGYGLTMDSRLGEILSRKR